MLNIMIKLLPLKNEHYRQVKGIFAETFPMYTRKSIISAWKTRDYDHSIGIYDTNAKSIIGFALIHKTDHNSLFLSYFAIHKEKQNMGIGTIFMKYILSRLKKQRKSINLVPLYDVACWYESLGFHKTGGKYLLQYHYYDTQSHGLRYNK
jgi:ribosomal protein S18 acetylase RimI-like enzyme